MIPCYNTEKYCKEVIRESLRWVSFLILVDDGSTDGTGMILHQLAKEHREKIHLISFSKNRGKGAALLAGMKYALSSCPFDVLLTLDSDGQHLPAEIPKLISCVVQGAGLAIGCRSFDQMPLRNRLANTVIAFLLRQLYSDAPFDTQSGFRAFSRQFVGKIVDQVTGCRYEMEFQCILLALRDKDPIACCRVATVYLNSNRSSHFSKIRDSFRILRTLFHHWRSILK